MPTIPPNTIASVAPTLADLKRLSTREQGILLLKRLAHLFPRQENFSRANFFLNYPAPDPCSLATGYDQEEVRGAISLLFGEPWHYIVQEYYIAPAPGGSHFEVSEKGWLEVEKKFDVHIPNPAVIRGLAFMHTDLRYEHYFHKQKLKEAVTAAFTRVENRLNEIRDLSTAIPKPIASGVTLPHELYDSGVLRFPFPEFSKHNQKDRKAYSRSLRNFLPSWNWLVQELF